MFDYKDEDESDHDFEEIKFKLNFFLPLIDHTIESFKDGFSKMPNVVEIFNFVLNQENLLKESESNLFNAF